MVCYVATDSPSIRVADQDHQIQNPYKIFGNWTFFSISINKFKNLIIDNEWKKKYNLFRSGRELHLLGHTVRGGIFGLKGGCHTFTLILHRAYATLIYIHHSNRREYREFLSFSLVLKQFFFLSSFDIFVFLCLVMSLCQYYLEKNWRQTDFKIPNSVF